MTAYIERQDRQVFYWLKSLFGGSDSPPSTETALAYFRSGKFAKALECADKIIAFAPDVALSWRFKAECLSEMERYSEAIQCYRKAIELGGPGTEDLPNNIAIVQFCLGQHKEALETISQVLQSNATNEIKEKARELENHFSANMKTS